MISVIVVLDQLQEVYSILTRTGLILPPVMLDLQVQQLHVLYVLTNNTTHQLYSQLQLVHIMHTYAYIIANLYQLHSYITTRYLLLAIQHSNRTISCICSSLSSGDQQELLSEHVHVQVVRVTLHCQVTVINYPFYFLKFLITKQTFVICIF